MDPAMAQGQARFICNAVTSYIDALRRGVCAECICQNLGWLQRQHYFGFACTKAGGENNLNIAAYKGPKLKHCWFPPQVTGVLHEFCMNDSN